MKIRNSLGRKYEIVTVSRPRMSLGQSETLNSISKLIKSEVYDPSYSQLSQLANLDSRTIQRSVRGLEKKGLIKVTERYSSSGYQLSNRYELTLAGEECLRDYQYWNELFPIDEPFVQRNQNNVYHLVPPSAEKIAQSSRGEIAPPSEEQNGAASCPTPNVVSTVVKEQLQLTNRLTSEERVSAAEMLSKIPIETAQQLADELRERMVSSIIKHPLGYLSKLIKAFENGTYYPVLASKGAEARISDAAKSDNFKLKK